MEIFVLISTIDDGIRKVPEVLLSEEEGVRYVVSWQRTEGYKENTAKATIALAGRRDVTVATMEGRGLSRNRNHALEVAVDLLPHPLAEAIAIIADDDERLTPDAFARIREAYASRPRLDIALMRVRSSADGSYLKPYPPSPVSYANRPRCYYPCSVEMTLRLRVWHAGLRFNERFGLGSPRLCAGEEDVFLHDAVRKGLNVMVLPIDIATTDPMTTGGHVLDVKVLRSKGAVYGYEYNLPRAIIRSLREAMSLGVRHRRNPWHILRNLLYGVKYVRQ